MAEATVLIERESEEPTTADDVTKGELAELDIDVADLQIVSEYALMVAVKALQWLKLTSRCHNSRVVAGDALAAIGMMGDLETDEEGLPELVRFSPEQDPSKLPMVRNHYRWLD